MAWGHGGTIWGYRATVRASRDAGNLIVLLVNHDDGLAPTPLFNAWDKTVPALYCGT
jgi:hypothetical protein